MTAPRSRYPLAVAALLSFSMTATAISPALGQPPDGQREAAKALFEEGRQLMQAKRYKEACAKFRDSMLQVPGIGIQFTSSAETSKLARELADLFD